MTEPVSSATESSPYNEEAWIRSLLSVVAEDMRTAAENDIRYMLEQRTARSAVATNSELIERLHKTARCVYLATEAGPAADIARTLTDAANALSAEGTAAQSEPIAWLVERGADTDGYGARRYVTLKDANKPAFWLHGKIADGYTVTPLYARSATPQIMQIIAECPRNEFASLVHDRHAREVQAWVGRLLNAATGRTGGSK